MNSLTRLTIRSQLVIVFLVLAIPIILLNWYAGEQTQEILKNQVTDAYVELIKQNHSIIDRDIDTVSRIMTTIIQNPLTQSFGTDSTSVEDIEVTIDVEGDVGVDLEIEDQLPLVQRYQAMQDLLASNSMGIDGGQTIRYTLFIPDPDNLYSFAPDYQSTNRSFVFFFDNKDKPDWYDPAIEMKGKGELKMIETSDPQPVKTLALIRAVNDLSKGNKVIGVLVATNLDRKFGDSLKSVVLPEGNTIALTDLNNRLYYGTGKSAQIGEWLELPHIQNFTKAGSNTQYMIDEDNISVIHENYDMSHRLIYQIPTVSLTEQQDQLKRSIQVISIVYFLLFFLFVLYFLRSLIAPLLKMVTFFKVYEPGKDVPKLAGMDRRDEVGSLVSSIHDLANRFNQLVHDKYITDIRNKEAQLNLLYQQINPHLLYNTLESVYWKCILQGENEAADMIKDLSKLMRISLSRGRELIALGEEIEHARAYLHLQQKRFDYRFQVEWHIPDAVTNCLIPKVSLQPLIENAILHGVRHMEEDGWIGIFAIQGESHLSIHIEDNGYKKVDIDKMNAHISGEESTESVGYGASNVHRRIQLHYGTEYGLLYSQRDPQGTRVTIVLPLKRD